VVSPKQKVMPLDLYIEWIETYSLSQARVEGITLQGATTANSGGDDKLIVGIHVHKLAHIAKVFRWVTIGGLEAFVVVLNDRIKEGRKQSVRLSIGRVQTNARVEIFNT